MFKDDKKEMLFSQRQTETNEYKKMGETYSMMANYRVHHLTFFQFELIREW